MAVGLVVSFGCAQSNSMAGDCSDESARARRVARKLNEEWPLRSPDYVTDLVEAVVARLAAGESRRNWQIVVFRSRKPEAYAIGDGRLYISDGSVRECATESELAAIIAHEMSHQLLDHFCSGNRSRGQPQLLGSISLQIDPDKELEADRFGLELIARSGYDPRAALSVVRRLQIGTSRSHLDESERAARLERLLERYSPREGYESPLFVDTRRRLQAERGLNE